MNHDIKPPRQRRIDDFAPRSNQLRPAPARKVAQNHVTPTVTQQKPAVVKPAPTRVAIDLPPIEAEPTKSGRRFLFLGRKQKNSKNHTKLQKRWPRKRIVKWALILPTLAIFSFGGFFAWKVFNNTGKVFKGNAFNAITAAVAPDVPLKMDQYGNTNILALGTSESDPGHPGAQLTDSMMVVSINKANHSAFLLSIPRDLWVTYEHPCSAGYSGKINATYECALGTSLGGLNNTQNDEITAETATADKVGQITGVNINYVVHMNLSVIQKVVDAVGGVDITIQSPDPRGILDRNFDWRCGYKCYLVKYPNGPAHLDGTHAMWLVQARNDAGGYGLPRSNFDREDNQRKVILALKDKAASVGFLSNPINAINLLDAMGSNIHTTVDSSEIKSFIDVVKDVPTTNMVSLDILSNAPGVLTTGVGPDGSSIVRPAAGLEDYSNLQALITKMLMGQAGLIEETASVDVLNGSGVSGAANQELATLQQAGFTIGKTATVPTTASADKYTVYDLSKGAKPNTLAALKKQLGVTNIQTTLPSSITSTASFVVVLNSASNTTSSATTQ